MCKTTDPLYYKTKMKKIVTESFKTNTTLMRILGWYHPENSSKLYTIRQWIMYSFFIVLITAITIANILIERRYDEMQMIYITETCCYCLKLLPFLTSGQRIKKCIHYFDDLYFAPSDDEEKKISDRTVAHCKRISMVYLVGVLCTFMLSVVPVMFKKKYELPLQVWLPYDATSRAKVYYPTLLYLSTATLYVTSVTSLIDPLIGGLAYHATAQLKTLKHRLQNLHKSEKNIRQETDFAGQSIHENLIKCVHYHRKILEYVQQYEKCFSWPVFNQFLGTTFSLCFCCIAVTKVPLMSVDSLKYLSLFLVAIWQVFFYCYYGTLLFEENNTLVTDIYMGDWYKYDVKTRKLLLIIMERSKREIVVTSGKLIDLTLETFSTMIRRSYSMVAVFK